MGRIRDDAARAFREGQPFSRGNTTVEVLNTEDGRTVVTLLLYDHAIARRTITANSEQFKVRTAGYETWTTKDRLNAIGLEVHQENFDWYLNGKLWEDCANWTEVKEKIWA